MTVTQSPAPQSPAPSPRPAAAQVDVSKSAPPKTPAPPATPARTEQPSMGELVADVSKHVSTLVQSEIELAKLELRSTVKNAGVGAGLFAGAAVVLVFSLTFGFIALAEGIAALGLSRWLAFLIVFVFQLLLVGAFVFIGIKKIKRVKAPERTIATSKETVAYLRSHS